MAKLNLGCGFDKRDGWVNADAFAQCDPDVLMDIETFPWPFEDDSFDHILMKHVLEHVGAAFSDFRLVMRELYRVIRPGGTIEIHVPHYGHESFWSDPTHVRAFTKLTFDMMSRKKNDDWIARRVNYTMLAYALGVDFEVVRAVQIYDRYWLHQEAQGRITRDELRRAAEEKLGVVSEIHITVQAIKPWA